MTNKLSAELESILAQTTPGQLSVQVPCKLLFRIAAELKLREQVEAHPRREVAQEQPIKAVEPENV